MSEPLSVELRWIRLPGVTKLRASHGTIADREVIIVRVEGDDGAQGWGECSALPRPGYTAEYLRGAWVFLREVLIPDVLVDAAGSLDRLGRVPGHPMARAALVGALVDLDLRRHGLTLVQALADGAEPRRAVPSTAVVGIHESIDELEAAVAACLERGHRSVKLKVDPGHDLESVHAVRSAWPDLDLAVDANGSYPDADSATVACRRLEQAAGELAYVEQPLPADDLVGAAIVARRIETPLALDESITSIGGATTALSMGALGVLNLKPARVGGPLTAITIARIVASEGIPVFCGGMVESGIGRASALAVAAQPECILPTDLGPSDRYHQVDVTRPFGFADGALDVPTGPGIGVVPDRETLEALTIEKHRVSSAIA